MNFAHCSTFQVVTVQQVTLDILHVMCLGVATYVLGNVLWEALGNTGLARAKKEGLASTCARKRAANSASYSGMRYLKNCTHVATKDLLSTFRSSAQMAVRTTKFAARGES